MKFRLRTLFGAMTLLGLVSAAIARAGFEAVLLAVIVAEIHVIVLLGCGAPVRWLLRVTMNRLWYASLGCFVAVTLVVLVAFAMSPQPTTFVVWTLWPGMAISTVASLVGAAIGWHFTDNSTTIEAN